jgi:hypothetical protein
MLGMVSGWSSTFEPGPAGRTPADSPKKELTEAETKVTKPVTSFHGILTDYEIVGSKKYAANEYTTQMLSSPSDKVTVYSCKQ